VGGDTSEEHAVSIFKVKYFTVKMEAGPSKMVVFTYAKHDITNRKDSNLQTPLL
jgi:hypothetical protein